MRGFPLLNLLLSILVSGAVVLPLVHRATRVATPTAELPTRAQPAPESQSTHAHVSLRFVHPPQVVRLKSGDVILREWIVSSPELLLDDSIALPFTDHRSEFSVEVEWPAGTPDTVIALTVEPDGLAARTNNIWSSGNRADELVTMTWKGGAP
jgi:hypothetical protein